jgi:hypothetical protein
VPPVSGVLDASLSQQALQLFALYQHTPAQAQHAHTSHADPLAQRSFLHLE